MNIFATFFNIPVLLDAFPLLMRGLVVTVELGIVAMVLGLVLGLFLALLRLYGAAVLRMVAGSYINVFRSIPLLVLLIIVYYALPFVGIRLSPFWSAVAALTLVSGAYTAEIFRAGIQAIPKGQFEASEALGLGYTYMNSCAAADKQLHKRHEGHRSCVRRGNAGPAEGGDASAGCRRQPNASDWCCDHLSHLPMPARDLGDQA
jgi:His/Glu/Gln/Arg/opine family amino acid ABC transporter permease subunit